MTDTNTLIAVLVPILCLGITGTGAMFMYLIKQVSDVKVDVAYLKGRGHEQDRNDYSLIKGG